MEIPFPGLSSIGKSITPQSNIPRCMAVARPNLLRLLRKGKRSFPETEPLAKKPRTEPLPGTRAPSSPGSSAQGSGFFGYHQGNRCSNQVSPVGGMASPSHRQASFYSAPRRANGAFNEAIIAALRGNCPTVGKTHNQRRVQ